MESAILFFSTTSNKSSLLLSDCSIVWFVSVFKGKVIGKINCISIEWLLYQAGVILGKTLNALFISSLTSV